MEEANPAPSPATTPVTNIGAVSRSGTGSSVATSMHAGGGKQTICWHCLKPLPRCSICLMHMGSEVGGSADSAEMVVSLVGNSRKCASKNEPTVDKTDAVKPTRIDDLR